MSFRCLNECILCSSYCIFYYHDFSRTVRELQLEKVQLEMENKEVEKKLRQLQSNMSREKEERK